MFMDLAWLIVIPVSAMLVILFCLALAMMYELLITHMWDLKDDE